MKINPIGRVLTIQSKLSCLTTFQNTHHHVYSVSYPCVRHVKIAISLLSSMAFNTTHSLVPESHSVRTLTVFDNIRCQFSALEGHNASNSQHTLPERDCFGTSPDHHATQLNGRTALSSCGTVRSLYKEFYRPVTAVRVLRQWLTQ